MSDENQKAATDKMFLREELEGMAQIAESLANKSKEQRMRMMNWAADKFCGCTLCYRPELKTR